MAFEIFTDTRSRSSEFISINETQSFGFSRAFLDAYGITKNHKLVIMYDEDEKKVALQFIKGDVKHGFSIQINNEKHGGVVKAKSFFDKKALPIGRYARRYHDFEVVDANELGVGATGKAFVITLHDQPDRTVEEGGSGRHATAVFQQR